MLYYAFLQVIISGILVETFFMTFLRKIFCKFGFHSYEDTCGNPYIHETGDCRNPIACSICSWSYRKCTICGEIHISDILKE